jgi:predicted Zn-dependent protease
MSTEMSVLRASVDHSSAGRDINVTAGLDEEQTRNLIADLLKNKESGEFARCADRYFAALAGYCAPSYRTLSFPQDISVEDVYVPLRASTREGGSQSVLLSQALCSTFERGIEHVFIEGRPGSGKSTLLWQVARHAWATPGSVGLDRRYIPLPIRLRSYAESDGAGREDRIWTAISRAHQLEIAGSRPPTGFFDKWPQLLNAPWLLLLDGFDEVQKEKRQEVLGWLKRLVKEKVPFVLTSRPTKELEEEFKYQPRFELDAFSPEQQSELAARWLGERASDFEAAFERFAKGELGGTPLLLTIAAIVYRDTGELPLRRSELYRQFVQNTWKEALNKGATEELGSEIVETADALIPRCLSLIARTMSETRGEGTALDFASETNKLAQVLTKVLAADLHLSERIATFRANKLLEFLGSRGGVFQTSSYHCEWLHPTFREYLTAEAFAEESSEQEIDELLAKCGDAAWRQVVLFLIAIRSEKERVDSILRGLKPINPPEGLALAATAIAEGANVEFSLVEEVVGDLCQAVEKLSEGDLCARLLVTGDMYKLRPALQPFIHMPELERPISKLKMCLARAAITFGRNRSCGIEDLEEFGATDTLTQIANDAQLPLSLRADAARSLCALRVPGGYEVFLEIVKLAPDEAKQWSVIATLLARTEDVKLLGTIAKEGSISDDQWQVILDALDTSKQKLSIFTELASYEVLTFRQRLAARLRMMDIEHVKEVLPTLSEQPENLRACINVLVKNGQGETLLKAILNREFNSNVRLAAFRGLAKLKSTEEFKRIVEADDVPYRIRRMAVQSLYGSPIGDDTDSLLLRFFDAQRNCERPPNLTRRAFLHYKLGHNEEALTLLDRAFACGKKSAWALGLYAHCLQRLGKIDQALTKYTDSLDLNRYASFERCQRAFLYWSQGELTKALEDVQQTGAHIDQKWFLPYGAEILWKGGQLKAAQEWLDAAVKDDPGSYGLPLLLRGLFRFQQGQISESLKDFRQLTNLEQPAGLDWFYLSNRRNMSRALRVSGALEEAITEYSKQIDLLSLQFLCCERAETRLRKRDIADADTELKELRTLIPDLPFFVYLDGLCKCFQGNKQALQDAATRALALTPEDTSAESTSNRALYEFARENADGAQSILDKLVADKQFDQLRYHTIFNLDTLAQALPDRADIASAIDHLKKIAWPEGWDPNPILVAFRALSRGNYPFPMYCQKSTIAGLEKDKDLGERVLNFNRSDERSILLWKLDQANRLYGQCNFKKDTDDDYELKFCDSVGLTLSTNLSIFVRDFEVRRLLFLEEDLLAKFKSVATAKRLPVKCELARTSVAA